jgi:DNA methylase
VLRKDGTGGDLPTIRSRTIGWTPSCRCDDRVRPGDIDPPIPVVPCRVLDPFAGSGTTVAIAERLGRIGIGVELKSDYLGLAKDRTRQAYLLEEERAPSRTEGARLALN